MERGEQEELHAIWRASERENGEAEHDKDTKYEKYEKSFF